MRTAHASRHLAPLLPGILLVATLLGGCDDNAEPAADPQPTITSSDRGSESPEPTTAEADLGPHVDRPTYSFNLPKGWKDTTDEHMVTDPGDTYSNPEDTSAAAQNRWILAVSEDSPYTSIEAHATDLLIEQRDFFSPKIRRLPDIDFEGEKAIHTFGPGKEPGSHVQSFFFLREGTSYDLSFQVAGDRAHNDELVKIVTDTWKWK